MAKLSPQVKWAQRKECIILTIDTAPCPKSYTFEVNSNSIIFRLVFVGGRGSCVPGWPEHQGEGAHCFRVLVTNATSISGKSLDSDAKYDLTLRLYGAIRSQYKQSVTDSKLQLCLTRRKDKYWPRLLATKDKVAGISVNLIYYIVVNSLFQNV